MLRDASRCQVVEKFSFIESLSLSRPKIFHVPANLGQVETDQVLSFQGAKISDEGQLLATKTLKMTPQKTPQSSSAIVPRANTATTIDSNWYQSTTDYSLSLAQIIQATTDNAGESNLKVDFDSSSRSGYWGRMLFALACSYGLFVSWWLFGHQVQNLITTMTGGKRVLLSKSEVEFIDYMERSLDQIDRQIVANKKPNNETVYVPVYTPAPATPTIPSSNSNLPLALPNSNSSSLPAVAPSPVAPVEPLAIPAPPPLPEPTPITDNSANSVASNQPINQSSNQLTSLPTKQELLATAPSVEHTLIGVLELGGDRSAALVKVQGQTRRVWLGEEINSTGWVLESIADQRANISYQGQVRSIAVGETF